MPDFQQYLRTPTLTAQQALAAPTTELVGVPPGAAAVLDKALRIKTIRDLAESPEFGFAREITRSVVEARHKFRRFGVPVDRVVKAWERRPVTDLVTAGLSALEGIGDVRMAALQKELGVSSVGELGAWPPYLHAVEILRAAREFGQVRSRTVTVEGRVVSERAAPIAGLTLRLCHVGFGGELTVLGQTRTNEQGYYAAELVTSGTTNLEIHALGAEEDDETVPLAGIQYGVGERVIMNLVAPVRLQAREPEYTRLSRDVRTQLDSISKLEHARERPGQRDLTLLNRATGWDARLLALASTAAKLSKHTGIDPEGLYGLLRAGLPSNPAKLARVSVPAVEAALDRVAKAEIISLSRGQHAETVAAFEAFARTQLRAARAPGAASSYGDFMTSAGLTTAERSAFEGIYFTRRPAKAELWDAIEQAGVPRAKVEALRLQGKLAYLTHNSAPLTRELQSRFRSLEGLVDEGFYTEKIWKSLLWQIASNDSSELERMIPTMYRGTAEERLDAYAVDLARRVRLSFPTRVVAARISGGELRLGERHAALAGPVRRFLDEAKAIDPTFELGQVSLGAFIRDNQARLLPQGGSTRDTEVIEAVKTLQRLYQITPSDESMQVLLDLGFRSAHDVAAVAHEVFIDLYGASFASYDEARLVHQKAEQGAATTYSFFGAAKQLQTTPGLAATSPGLEAVQQLTSDLATRYPTLEGLFGSLDYCECEHCRSVLSPAAYLVDLLQLLEPDDEQWMRDVKVWSESHGGEVYEAGWAEQPDILHRKPYHALVQRRPDIPYLPLTCENTNSALPYIDLVNEILEYHVAHGALDEGASHDTGAATTAELLAEPRHVLAPAYTTLAAAKYPLSLPFDLWLEQVRSFLAHHEVSLVELLEAFRVNDELIEANGSYGHQAVFMEALGLSSKEHELLTEPNLLTGWLGLYGYGAGQAAAAVAELRSAKHLSRRLGVSYGELIRLVQTWFVNPHIDEWVSLRRLGIDLEDVFRYHGEAGYQALLPQERAELEDKLDRADARAWFDKQWGAGTFRSLLILADPSAGCDFEATTLQYADGRAVDDKLVFHKLNLFVRLWRKLGWTLEETDHALRIFVPTNLRTLGAAQLGAAMRSALVYISHLREVARRLGLGPDAVQKVATLWSALPIQGKDPLYEDIISSLGDSESASIFDDPLGHYLSNPVEHVKDHIPALCGATGLSAEDVQRVLLDIGEDPEQALVSLALVSALYRYGLLSRALKMSVRELIALKTITGLDPFAQLLPGAVNKLAHDRPFTQTLAFLDIVDLLGELGLKIAEIEYLTQHAIDPVGPHRMELGPELQRFRALSAGLRRISADHGPTAEPLTASDDSVREKLALVVPQDVVDAFLSMWTRTAVFEATESAAQGLDPDPLANEPDLVVSYDAAHQVQHLSYRGVLTATRKDELHVNHPSPLLERLLDDVDRQGRAFFSTHFVATGLFEAADYELLFGGDEAARRGQLIEDVLAFVGHRLETQFVIQTLAAELDADPELIALLTVEGDLVSDPSDAGVPIRDAFASAGVLGVSAAFHASEDAGDAPAAVELVPTIRSDSPIAGEPGHPARPAGTNSAVFEGYLVVPVSGPYRFFVTSESPGGEAELTLDDHVNPVLRGPVTSDGGVVELRAGVPHRFRLQLSKLADAAFFAEIQGPGLSRGDIGRLTLHPEASVERVRRAYVVLSKAIFLADRLSLTKRELRHVLTHTADFADIDLARLPTTEDRAAGSAQFAALRGLLAYAALKARLGGTDDLVQVFARARRSHPPNVDQDQAKEALARELFASVAAISRREPTTIEEAVNAIGWSPTAVDADGVHVAFPAFCTPEPLRRLWRVLELSGALGVSPAVLAGWATPTPGESTAREVKDTLRANYDSDAWHRVARSIFDGLRKRQRDALVSFVMHELRLPSVEALFEHFLIDPGMEPVVQTSRIQLAIASVQLFVQRSLLNLEEHVRPSVLNAQHWQWMKRYRLWEANRKIWLFPENWLEPEFRDDKTHLYEEMERALLREDISDERAEAVLFDYLKGLEGLAQLQMVAMYAEEKSDAGSSVLHVLGRTASRPHAYFYRRRSHQTWTPWQPVEVDIEGEHVVMVVWRDRLLVLWVTFLGNLDQVRAQLYWTEHTHGQWSSPKSGGSLVHERPSPSGYFDPATVAVHVSKESDANGLGAVRVHLSSPINQAFRLVSPHVPVEVKPAAAPPTPPYNLDERRSTWYRGSGSLEVSYVEMTVTEDGGSPEDYWSTHTILGMNGQFDLLLPANRTFLPTEQMAPLVAPFFFQDNRSTFYVEPTLTVVPIDLWEEWVIPIPDAEEWPKEWPEFVPIDVYIPDVRLEMPFWGSPDVGDPGWTDPRPLDDDELDSGWTDPHPDALFEIRPRQDWTTDPLTILQFEDGFVGRGGGLEPFVLGHSPTTREEVPLDIDGGGTASIHVKGESFEVSQELTAAAAHGAVTGVAVTVSASMQGAAPVSQYMQEGAQVIIVDSGGLNLNNLSVPSMSVSSGGYPDDRP